jgi:SOS-response transcriptional repressor LexA
MPDLVINPSATIRPTKKQQALLEFIAQFIAEHGYSPSYREIMTGLGYTSVATVALHVNNLIKRGHLQKRERSARSLEVVSEEGEKQLLTSQIKVSEEKWLVDVVEARFYGVETCSQPQERDIDSLYVLVGALRVLGLEEAACSFIPRLSVAKTKIKNK